MVRSHVGAGPSDGELDGRFDRLANVEAVALEVLRERRANLLAQPQRFSADGDFSEDWGDAAKQLSAQVTALEVAVRNATTPPMPTIVTAGRLVRGGRRR